MEDVIKQAIYDALTTLGVTEPLSFVVEHPAELAHGDYACNVALVAAKPLGQAPLAIAEQLAAALANQIEYIERIEVAGPGFLNFHLTRDFFTAELQRTLQDEAGWGKNDSWSGKKVLVEYTDSNPFKEFHIGHLFTNAVGESIARLFMMNGADVKRICYQGDVGLHVAHAVWGMQQHGVTPVTVLTAKDLGRAYTAGATAYKDNEEAQIEIRELNKKIYDRSDEVINTLYDKGRAVSLAYFETVYTMVGTAFDEYFFESEAGPKGKTLVLENPEYFPVSDGAHVFKGEDYGLHTRVFLNKEGLPTYEAKELALAKLKEERLGEYDHSVISTAKEINEYFKVLLKAMSFVYPELASKTEHIGHGMVRLSTGKMSSRTGDVIAATDFIKEVMAEALGKAEATALVDNPKLTEQVAIAAIKYETLRGSILQDSVFDKSKALSFEGDSGPYLQYTHARIGSVLEKAAGVGVTPSVATAPAASYEIEHQLYRFPEIIEEALRERAPHLVTTYLTQLASAFNTFYAHEKIADPDDEYAPYKAAVTAAVGTTLKNGLWTLGIEAPERM